MHTRRTALISLAGALVVARAAAETDEAGLPKPTVIPGKPPIMDYGQGVKVPAGKGAFLTLWEGETFWLTFGFGISHNPERAKGEAVHHAVGAMKYLLLTLAFAPDRLEKVDGNGWHQKVESPVNYVLGEIELPGHPGMPMTDAFKQFGNADQMNLGGVGGTGDIGPGGGMGQSGPGGYNSAMLLGKVNAFCSYVVWKKDLALADVRTRAKMVQM
jgi:hypothetical protein